LEILPGSVAAVSALGPSLVEAGLLHFHWFGRCAFPAERSDGTVSFGGGDDG